VIAFLGLASVLSWSSNSARTTARNNQYWRTVAAAEAATEKVLTRLEKDFQRFNGERVVYNNSRGGTKYGSQVPTAADNSYWSSYVFSDGLGNHNRTYVALAAGSQTNWTTMNSKYAGLFGFSATYLVRSYARENPARFDVSTGVQQTVQLATIPAFQFAIFYNVDLEIEPGPDMTVTGRVHGNGNIYQNPMATLTFQSDLTSSGTLMNGPVPGDPSHSGLSPGSIVYGGAYDSKAPKMTLPISNGSNPDTVYEILKLPPLGGESDPALGSQRYFNNADVIIRVTDAGVIATSGSLNFFSSKVIASSFLTVSTNKFYNGRERKGVNIIDIDVGKFKTWVNSSDDGAKRLLKLYGREPNSIYIIDQRTLVPAGTEPGVRLINGAQLPDGGLTVATPDPLYVKGDFNVKDSTGPSSGSDTTHTKPASLIADAITVLSNGWDDNANANSIMGNLHGAQNSTVNAAFLAGIVQTSASSYSGGVENFPRFLENWSGNTFTYNGSMVVMFYSKIAIGIWRGTGGYYNPPTRNWAFDNNFLNPAKLPPLTPAFHVLIRGDWQTLGRDPAS
jgi:hypothetical protein